VYVEVEFTTPLPLPMSELGKSNANVKSSGDKKINVYLGILSPILSLSSSDPSVIYEVSRFTLTGQ